MNRRNFLMAASSAAATASALNPVREILAAQTTTSFYVKGLIMLSFEDSKMLRLGLPNAPGHKATMAMVPQTGSQRSVNLKGTYTVETAEKGSGRPDYKIPELIRMQELYGNDIHSRVDECPTVIHIPYAAIRSITTAEVSPTRYTFVRADNGQEVTTFRPRKVAETLRIELSSDSTLTLPGGKIAMNTLKEVHTEYSPDAPATQADIDAFAKHFPHYFAYLDRPATANYDVLPKNLGSSTGTTPKIGNNFMPFYPYYPCFVIAL